MNFQVDQIVLLPSSIYPYCFSPFAHFLNIWYASSTIVKAVARVVVKGQMESVGQLGRLEHEFGIDAVN